MEEEWLRLQGENRLKRKARSLIHRVCRLGRYRGIPHPLHRHRSSPPLLRVVSRRTRQPNSLGRDRL